MLKILFIGDIVGKIGRKTVGQVLPKLKRQEKIDFVIANGENSSHGTGITKETIEELTGYGVDFFTGGDHSFRKMKDEAEFKKYPVIRPANFAPQVPGEGYKIVDIKNKKALIVSLIGRVFMKTDHDCPFYEIDEILANINLRSSKISAIIVDIHAEATSEKAAFLHYIDGRVSAILGTHTHVQTADERITAKGTGFITDAGMVGFSEGSLGLEKESIIETFLTQIKYPHVIPEEGPALFNACLLEIDPKTKKTSSIKRVSKYLTIQ